MEPGKGREQTLADVGEDGILSAILTVFDGPSAWVEVGPGDDCAVLAAPDGRFVVTTDLLVEGADFRLPTSTGYQVGAKAAAQNLADIAAMGARATGLVIGLVAPASTPLEWVVDLARGVDSVVRPAGAVVVGGDLSGGPVVMLSVTVFGDLEGREPVLRSGARPGDVLALAGTVGRAAAGLEALAAGVSADIAQVVVDTQRAARPPLAAGPAAASAGATSLIDVSDGLLRDAGRIALASGVHVEIDCAATALTDLTAELSEVARVLPGQREEATAWRWVLTGGEDHGLLATFAPGTTLPDGFAVIGRANDAGQRGSVSVAGLSADLLGEVLERPGWDHYVGG